MEESGHTSQLITLGGVEGRVGALGWDQEELTSFTHSHEPAHNPHKVVSAQLEHLWCQDEPRTTRTHQIHHGLELREVTTFPFIGYYVDGHGAYIQMVFFSWDSRVGLLKQRRLGLSQLWSPITLRTNFRSRCSLQQSCSYR